VLFQQAEEGATHKSGGGTAKQFRRFVPNFCDNAPPRFQNHSSASAWLTPTTEEYETWYPLGSILLVKMQKKPIKYEQSILKLRTSHQ
jgi:hypothetical protein